MKVRIKSATRVRGQHLAEGKVLSVSDEDGYILLAANKAERIVDAPKPEAAGDAGSKPAGAPPSE